MPALERRGSISRTVHVPDGSAFLFPTSSGTGGSSSSSARAAVSNLLGYTASAASYVGKSLTTVTGGGGGGGQSSEGKALWSALHVCILLCCYLPVTSKH